MENVTFKLVEVLKQKHMSQYRLHIITELHLNTIRAYCRGTIKRIHVDNIIKICNALDCKMSDIIEYIPNKK